MPIYDFKCQDCERVFEAISSASQSSISRKCPDCGGLAPRDTKASKTSFVLKGGGWTPKYHD